MLHRSAIATLLTLSLVAGQASAQPDRHDLGPKTADELLELHNAARAKEGVPALKLDPKLTEAAQKYADYLAKSGKKGHLADGNPGTRIKDTGYRAMAFAENMAKGEKSPEAAFKGWMRSDGHRKNILNKAYHAVGFGYAKGPAGGIVWIADFGASGPNKPVHRHNKK